VKKVEKSFDINSLTTCCLYVKLVIAPFRRSFFCAVNQRREDGCRDEYAVHPKLLTGAGGVQNESQDSNGMYGLQAKELQYQEKQEE
jgi:hypothetical protein